MQNLSSLPPVVDNIFDKYNKNLVPIRSLSDHDISYPVLNLIPEMLYINEFPVCFVLGCIYCSCKSSLIPGMLYSWTWS